MPQVIPIVVYYAATALGYGATVAAIASAVASVAVSAQQSRKARRAAVRGAQAALRDRTVTVRSAAEPHQVIYGRARVSGPIAFVISRSGASTNDVMDMIIPYAGHQVQGVDQVWFNDDLLTISGVTVTTPRYTLGRVENRTQQLVVAGSAVTVTPSGTLVGVDTVSFDPGGGDPTQFVGVVSVVGNVVNLSGVTDGTPVWVDYRQSGVNFIGAYVDQNGYLGTSGQAADAGLMADYPGVWTSAHRLRGRAYLRVTLNWHPDVWFNGIPNVSAVVQGRNQCFDPRGSTAWSDNVAVCIRDYLSAPFGLNCSAFEIDDASFIAAANVCDELVTVNVATDVPAPDQARWTATLQKAALHGLWTNIGDTTWQQKRYTCNGAFLLSEDPFSILAALESACAGQLTYTGGQWRLVAGAYVTPTMTLTEDDLRAPIQVVAKKARRDLFNTVRGTFAGPVNRHAPVDFEPVTNATYKSQDGGEEIATQLDLLFTDDQLRAQRIAKIELERVRQGIVVAFPAKLKALGLRPGDTVMLTLPRMGWSAKVFRVERWTLAADYGVDLVLQEDAPGIYAWNAGNATVGDLAPDTTLPSPWIVPDMGTVTITSGTAELLRLGDGVIQTRMKVSWTAFTDAAVRDVEVEYKRGGDVTWSTAGIVLSQLLALHIADVQDGQFYLVRTRAINALGIRGQWKTSVHLVIGKTALPPDLTAFSVSVLADGTRRFAMTAVTGVTDGAAIRVRLIAGSSTDYAAMTDLRTLPYIPGQATYAFETNEPVSGTWSFGAKLVDTSGNEGNGRFIVGAALASAPATFAAVSNLAKNSDFTEDLGFGSGYYPDARALRGWTFAFGGQTPNIGRNYADGTAWNIGRGGAHMFSDTVAPSANQQVLHYMPASAGVEYEASCYVNPHRCKVALYLSFRDAAGNHLAFAGGGPDELDAGTGVIGGPYDPLVSHPRLWRKGVAPVNTTQMSVQIFKWGTNTGASPTNSYAFWSRVLVCNAPAGVTKETATPWVPSEVDSLRGLSEPLSSTANGTGEWDVFFGTNAVHSFGSKTSIVMTLKAGDTIVVQGEFFGTPGGGVYSGNSFSKCGVDVVVSGAGKSAFTEGALGTGNFKYHESAWPAINGTDGTSLDIAMQYTAAVAQTVTIHGGGGARLGSAATGSGRLALFAFKVKT